MMRSISRSTLIVLLFFILFLGLFIVFLQPAKAAFLTNIFLNGTILGLFVFGLIYNFFLFFKLRNEAVWFSYFEKSRDLESNAPTPVILKPLRQLFQGVKPSAFVVQTIFSGIQNRFDETRDTNRYITGLLVFIGLLGTFWGLSHTVTSISGVISAIDLKTGNVQDAFNILREGLKAPLLGMGTAFSSSMFGLLASLVIGFIDVQYGKAIQGFFYYIAERIHLNVMSAVTEIDLPAGGVAYSQSLLEQSAESMHLLSKQLQRGEEKRTNFLKDLAALTEKLNHLIDQQNQQLLALQTLAQHQFGMQQVLTAQMESNADAVKYWRSIDAQFAKFSEDLNINKNQLSREVCEEIRTVSRILAALGEAK